MDKKCTVGYEEEEEKKGHVKQGRKDNMQRDADPDSPATRPGNEQKHGGQKFRGNDGHPQPITKFGS